MNVCTFAGNLGHDPRLNNLPSGEPVLNFSVAVKRRVKKGGQWEDQTLWIDCTVFGKRAEGLSKILCRGSRVGVTGELGLREYTARDGAAKTALELVCRDVEPLESRAEKEARIPSAQAAASGAAGYSRPNHRDGLNPQGAMSYGVNTGAPYQQGERYADPDDDIPF